MSILIDREVEVVSKILVKVLSAKDVFPDEICIMSAYHPQKSRLRHEVSQFKNVGSFYSRNTRLWLILLLVGSS